MSDADATKNGCDQCAHPDQKGIHTCEKRPEGSAEECARVDRETIARLKEALKSDVCQCDEVCPHCGKRKPPRGTTPIPWPYPVYPFQPQNPAPPFYPGSPPGQYPGVWCGTPPTP